MIIDIVIDASNENNSGKLVVYQSLLDSKTFARPVDEFLGVKGRVTNSYRFIKCEIPRLSQDEDIFNVSVTLPIEGIG